MRFSCVTAGASLEREKTKKGGEDRTRLLLFESRVVTSLDDTVFVLIAL